MFGLEMTMLKRIASLLLLSLVASCGGGSDAGTSLFGDGTSSGGGTSTTADLLVELSKSNVANTGSDSVIVTATALDAARNTISGATMAVSADSDAIVTTP